MNKQLEHKHVKKIQSNHNNLKTYISYYNELCSTLDPSYSHKALTMATCCSHWFFDTYPMQRVRDLQSVFTCKNKFCYNCQKILQAKRLYKYTPMLNNFLDNYYYMFTLTCPNVIGFDLRRTLKLITKAFKSLINYFSGHNKLKLLLPKGYNGAIKSLEITYNAKENTFHPHIHAVMSFAQPFELNKKHLNPFSFKRHKRDGDFKTPQKFSDFEILLQKIWRLLIDGVKVTKKNINTLPLGYSCQVDNVNDGDYYEAFKYCIKANGEPYPLDAFLTLDTALHRVRTIQGYGVFYNYSFDDNDSYFDDKDKFDDFLLTVKKFENPISECLDLKEVAEETRRGDYVMLNRNKHFNSSQELNDTKSKRKAYLRAKQVTELKQFQEASRDAGLLAGCISRKKAREAKELDDIFAD